MSAVAAAPPAIGPRQRLNATAALSLLFHGILILGLGFALDDEAPLSGALRGQTGRGKQQCPRGWCLHEQG